MASVLEQIKQHTTIVADSGDFESKLYKFNTLYIYIYIYACSYIWITLWNTKAIKTMINGKKNRMLLHNFLNFL